MFSGFWNLFIFVFIIIIILLSSMYEYWIFRILIKKSYKNQYIHRFLQNLKKSYNLRTNTEIMDDLLIIYELTKYVPYIFLAPRRLFIFTLYLPNVFRYIVSLKCM